MKRSSVGCYILAAGRSRRMGTPKALLKHAGEELIFAIARRYQEIGCEPIEGLVDSELQETLYENWCRKWQNTAGWDWEDPFGDFRLDFLVDVQPEQPMMDSVRVAFRHAIDHQVQDFFLQPVDAGVPQRKLLQALLDGIGDGLVAKPTHQAKGGHPLLIKYAALAKMQWAHQPTLREALRRLPEDAIRRIEWKDASVLRNWNRPEDLAADVDGDR